MENGEHFENEDRKVQSEPLSNNLSANVVATKPATGEQLEKTELKFDERMSAFERATINLTRLGIVIGIVTAFVFAGQLYEMYEAGKQTDQMIKAADINANAAASFSKTAEGINTEIAKAVVQLGYQVNALRENVKQSIELADATKTGISENRSALQLENRAWLGVVSQNIIQFVPGKHIKIDISLTNSGKTPANMVRTAVSVSVTADSNIIQLPITYENFVSTASVPPQGSHIVHITSTGILTGAQAAQIQEKSLLLAITGTVEYEDLNGTKRSTNICMYMPDSSTKEFMFCPSGNDMD